jgi:hypothetical protein
MADLAAIVKATRQSAAALKRAQGWNREALWAERLADQAMRRGNAAGEAAHLAQMHRALRLREQNMAQHERARAFLDSNPI